jgi:hypothetical protein
MARKSHHMPLSGGDRKALTKELGKTPGISAKFLTYLLTTRNRAMIAAWLVAVDGVIGPVSAACYSDRSSCRSLGTSNT